MLVSSNDIPIPELLALPHDDDIDGLVQERGNSIANALELRLSCANPSVYSIKVGMLSALQELYDEYLPATGAFTMGH